MLALTPQQIGSDTSLFIRQQGYAIIPKLFSGVEVSAVLSELSRAELPRSRAGARHILSVPAVRQLANDARLTEVAHAVLGLTAIAFRATLFDKSPSSNWLVAWHQDTALPLREKIESPEWGPWSVKEGVTYAHAPQKALEQVLALRGHLDDSTAENGPLRVIPATHCDGVLTDDEVQQRSSQSEFVECTVDAGGVIAMHPLLIHASSKSASDQPRRVLHIEYAAQLDLANGLTLALV